MVDLVQVACGIIGFAPAMALFYYTLRNYTYPKAPKPFFDDRKVFLFFAVGLILGMVIFAFETYGSTVGTAETVLLLIVGFAAMEELMKLVILNFPRFQRKIDTAFCGLSMGLGMGATFTFATIYSYVVNLPDPGATDFVIVGFLGILFVLLHSSTSALIGIGVARGDVRGYFPEALLIHLLFGLMYESFFVTELLEPPLNLVGLVGATAVVVYGFRKVHTTSLPALVRDAKRLLAKEKT
jgi:hypothetical protein